MREIAIRGFINEKYNTTYGKGLFRRAIYNGSVELHNPNQKYLVDFYDYEQFQHTAKSDAQIEVLKKLDQCNVSSVEGLVLSWIIHYEPLTKTKTPVDGYCIYLQSTGELHIEVIDVLNGTNEQWDLRAHHCKSVGANKPVFIGTNVDLNHK
ncbi:MAG: hypothetical protein WCR21_12735 [Bacteroidota bacterium]